MANPATVPAIEALVAKLSSATLTSSPAVDQTPSSLRDSLKTDSDCQAADAKGVLPSLIAMIASPTTQSTTQELAAGVVGRLVSLSPTIKSNVTKQGALFAPLSTALGAPTCTPGMKEICVKLMVILMQTADETSKGKASDWIPLLVPLLSSTPSPPNLQDKAVIALRFMSSEPSNVTQLYMSGVIQPLTAMMSSTSSLDLQHHAAHTLSRMLRDGKCEQSIIDSGAIPLSVQMLSSANPAVAEGGSTVIRQLAINDKNIDTIREAGAVSKLIHIVDKATTAPRHTAVAVENATAALSSLVRSQSVISDLITLGGLPHLFTQLAPPSPPQTQERALVAITLMFTYDWAPNLQASTLQPLVALLTSPTASVQEKAAAAVRQLASISEERTTLIQCGTVFILINMLRTASSVKLQEHAAAALTKLSIGMQNKTMVAGLGAINALVNVLQEQSESKVLAEGTLKWVLNCINSLARLPTNKDLVVADGGVVVV